MPSPLFLLWYKLIRKDHVSASYMYLETNLYLQAHYLCKLYTRRPKAQVFAYIYSGYNELITVFDQPASLVMLNQQNPEIWTWYVLTSTVNYKWILLCCAFCCKLSGSVLYGEMSFCCFIFLNRNVTVDTLVQCN